MDKQLHPIELNRLSRAPLVSIVTPCYNAASYIAETIESVLAQSYEHWEMVICDDGSTDDSASLIESYAGNDNRIRLIKQANSGAAAASNAAYSACEGDIIAFLDADDLFDTNKLAICLEALQKRPDCGFLTHRLRGINNEGKENGIVIPGVPKLVDGWFAPYLFDKIPNRGSAAPSAGNLVRREVMEKIMPIPVECQRTQDAYVLTCAMLLTPAIGLEKMLGSYRIHPGGQSRGLRYSEAYHARRIADQRATVSAIRGFCMKMGYAELAEYLGGDFYYENAGYLENVAIHYLLTSQLPAEMDHTRLGDMLESSGKMARLFKQLAKFPLPVRKICLRLVALAGRLSAPIRRTLRVSKN